jgi:5-methylcytosine-specific restriction endonuclease McrA
MRKSKAPSRPFNWDAKITSALRRVWRFSPQRAEALEAARSLVNPAQDVICALCGQCVDKRTAAVDHVEPVVGVEGFVSWDVYITRLKSTDLRVLCTPCHKAITKEQNAQRARIKREKKKVVK